MAPLPGWPATPVWDRLLLGIIAAGIIWLLSKIIEKGGDGWDIAAFLLVIQSVIAAVRDGRQAQSLDKTMENLADSTPNLPRLPAPPAKPSQSAADGAGLAAGAAGQVADELAAGAADSEKGD